MLVKFLTNPTVTMLIVVAVYVAVACLAWFRASIARSVGNKGIEYRMLAVTLLFLLLGLSYQGEFIPKAIALAKSLAKDHGWYAYRWWLATTGLTVIAAVIALVIASARRKFFRLHTAYWSVGFGSALLVGYFLLRATSIHWVHPWSGIHFGCPQSNPWIEVISAFFIGLGFYFTPRPTSVLPHSEENNNDQTRDAKEFANEPRKPQSISQIPAVVAAWRRKPRGLPRH